MTKQRRTALWILAVIASILAVFFWKYSWLDVRYAVQRGIGIQATKPKPRNSVFANPTPIPDLLKMNMKALPGARLIQQPETGENTRIVFSSDKSRYAIVNDQHRNSDSAVFLYSRNGALQDTWSFHEPDGQIYMLDAVSLSPSGDKICLLLESSSTNNILDSQVRMDVWSPQPEHKLFFTTTVIARGEPPAVIVGKPQFLSDRSVVLLKGCGTGDIKQPFYTYTLLTCDLAAGRLTTKPLFTASELAARLKMPTGSAPKIVSFAAFGEGPTLWLGVRNQTRDKPQNDSSRICGLSLDTGVMDTLTTGYDTLYMDQATKQAIAFGQHGRRWMVKRVGGDGDLFTYESMLEPWAYDSEAEKLYFVGCPNGVYILAGTGPGNRRCLYEWSIQRGNW